MRMQCLGTAGAGKSAAVRLAVDAVRDLLGEEAVAVCAHTGVAAFNTKCQASTLNSLFTGAGSKEKQIPDLGDAALKAAKTNLGPVRLLVIDEVSMINGRQFAIASKRLDQVMRELGRPDSGFGFGGIAVLLVGDFGQTAPIDPSSLIDAFDREAPSSADSFNNTGQRLFREFTDIVRLRRVHRQKGASEFKESTLRLRDGAMTPRDWDLRASHDLNEPGTCLDSRARSESFMHLCAEHRFVGARNGACAREQAMAAAREDPSSGKAAIVRVVAENSSNTAKEMAKDSFNGLRPVVHLLLDAPVMLIVNLLWGVRTVPLGLMNGARGRVKAIVYREGESPSQGHQPRYVVVAFDDYVGPPFFKGEERRSWVPVPPVKISVRGREEPWRRQVPLVLCWAVTLLKAQGLTVPEGVVVDLRSDGSKNWAGTLGVPFVGWTRAKHFHMWACRALPPLADFVKVRQLALFRAREAFEAWADEQHNDTMQRLGCSFEHEVLQHQAHLEALFAKKGQAASREDLDDLRSMLERRGVQGMPQETREHLAALYCNDKSDSAADIYRAMSGIRMSKGVGAKFLAKPGPSSKRPRADDGAGGDVDSKRARAGPPGPPAGKRLADGPRTGAAAKKRKGEADGLGGTDRAGLPTVAGRPVAGPLRRNRAVVLQGLYNQGNTCYFNAVTQALASLDLARVLAAQPRLFTPLTRAMAGLLHTLRPVPQASTLLDRPAASHRP